MSRGRLAWLALAAAAALSRFWDLGARAISFDESLHAYYSWFFATTGSFRHDPLMHGPWLFHLNAALFALVGASDAIARLTPALFGAALVVLPALLSRWIGRSGALASGGLLLISPVVLFYSRYLRNDIYIAVFTLLWVWAAFRWLEERRRRWLVVVTVAMGLAFSCKEVAFLFGLTIGGFVVLLALAARREQGRRSAAADLALLMVTLVLPFAAPLLHLAAGLDPKAYDEPGAATLAAASAGALALIATLLASLWLGRGRRDGGLTFATWTALAAGFWLAVTTLFTTFFTNWPRGLTSGWVGTLGYWLAQQPVRRGGQPWFYYLLLLALYELLPVGLAAVAGWRLMRRRRGRDREAAEERRARFLAFLAFWAVASVVLYSLAGEKMPWLLVHLTLPCCLLGGWLLGRLWVKRHELAVPLRFVAATGLALAALATAALAGRLAYRDYDLPTELLVYAHGAPGLHHAVTALAAAEARLPRGQKLVVAYDDTTAWPLLWYLRERSPRYFEGKKPTDAALAGADAVFYGPEHRPRLEPWLAEGYTSRDDELLWWPLQGYHDLTWDRLAELVTDTTWRRSALAYLVTRRWPGIELADWPLRQRYTLALRDELAPPAAVGESRTGSSR